MAIWLITGSSRGFGAAVAQRALDAGHTVIASGRSEERLRQRFRTIDTERLMTIRMDVTDDASVRSAVQAAVDRFGRIDVLVNNAGHGMVGALEEVSDEETRGVFEVNFFGALSVTRAVLPVMRRQRSGHVLAMSSYGGFTQPGGGFGVYGASKFALEGAFEALRNEVRELGIRVTLVEPGSFRTAFLEPDAVQVADRVVADYASFMTHARRYVSIGSGTQRGDPVKAAAAIVAMVEAGTDVLRLPLGPDAVAAIEQKLQQVARDLRSTARWSSSTDTDDVGG